MGISTTFLAPRTVWPASTIFKTIPRHIPFAVSQVLGFPQTMHAGSQLYSLDNTTIFTPNATWENRYGFIREVANATTSAIPDALLL